MLPLVGGVGVCGVGGWGERERGGLVGSGFRWEDAQDHGYRIEDPTESKDSQTVAGVT